MEKVRLLVELTIPDGKLEPFNAIAEEMVAGSRAEPGTLEYEWFLSRDGKRCRLLETYTDSAALLAHFKGTVVQELVPRLAELVAVDRFEVYGEPGPEAFAMMTPFGAEIFQRRHGLDR